MLLRCRVLLVALVALAALLPFAAASSSVDDSALLAALGAISGDSGSESSAASLLSLHDLSSDALALLQADASAKPLLDTHAHLQSDESTGVDATTPALIEMMAGANQAASVQAQAKVQAEAQQAAAQAAEAAQAAPIVAMLQASAHTHVDSVSHADADAETETETEAEAESYAPVDPNAVFMSAGPLASETFSEKEATRKLAAQFMQGSGDASTQQQQTQANADQAADFGEGDAAPALMEVSAQAQAHAQAHASLTAALSNQGRLGNYPGWTPLALLETLNQAEESAAAAEAAAPDTKPEAEAETEVEDKRESKRELQKEEEQPAAAKAVSQQLPANSMSPVKMRLPPEGPNVQHISLSHGSAKMRSTRKLGIAKVHVHAYGAADVEGDKQARLRKMVRRLAERQSDSYGKINAIIQKLKSCSNSADAKNCLPKLTAKMEDWKAEWLHDAKRA